MVRCLAEPLAWLTSTVVGHADLLPTLGLVLRKGPQFHRKLAIFIVIRKRLPLDGKTDVDTGDTVFVRREFSGDLAKFATRNVSAQELHIFCTITR